MKKCPQLFAGLVSLAVVAFAPASVGQIRPTHRADLPNFDNRTAPQQTSQEAAQRQNGLAHVKTQLPSTTVEFDELLGTPKFIRAGDGFLTGPNGQGRTVSAQAIQTVGASDPHGAIKAFLNEHTALFGHGAEAVNNARVKRDYVDAHNGLRTVVWEQKLDGLPVFQATLMGHITKKGELTSLSSTLVPDPATSANSGTPGRAALRSNPPISAPEAVALAAQNIGSNLAANEVVPAGGPSGDGGYLVFKTPQEAYARLVWLPLHRSSLRLAWEVMVSSRTTHERFLLVIDAQTGQAHLREARTFYISDATYNVYTIDSPSPFSPGLQTPGTFQPPITNRVLVTTPALDTTASPDGWIPDGGNTTTGNNVDAFVDRNYDQQPDQARPQGNPNRTFNFPLDLTMDPSNYIDAATTELFYKCNYYHDVLYQLGFTEASGNFQQNNFGRGGFGNDRVIGYVQAGADAGQADNAFFATPPDGFSGECAMFVWSFPVPKRDGSLDSDIMFHEFTHGTSWRLVGGGNNLGNLQGDGMGEGWSDFYALSLSSEPSDDPNAAYAAGGYATFQLGGLNENYYYGIRHFPYCTDMTKNPFTFKDIDPIQVDPHTGVPRSPIYPFSSQEASEVHHQGEIWCVTLWEVRANLIAKYGTTVGNQLMLQLVTDGMKLTPARPTFLQARDGILLADRVNNGGANNIEIWRGFAKRGMGASAVAPPSNTTTGVIEAYDFPSLTVDRVIVSAGNGNGTVDPNECNSLTILLLNNNSTNATGVSAQLFTSTKGALIAQANSTYPDILPGATNANSTPFKVSTAPTFVCGTLVDFSLVIKTDQETRTNTFRLTSGTNGTAVRFNNNTAVAILDNNPAGVVSPMVVSNITSVVGKVVVSAHITHTVDSQLTLQLISPGGITNTLSAAHGGNGDNYGNACSPDNVRTTFDDEAIRPISTATAPFVGSFRPDQPLAIFTGKTGTNINGTWKLRVVDITPGNTGTLQCWSLFLSPSTCTDGGGECPGVDLAIAMSALPEPVVVGEELNYAITVTNAGPDTAHNTVISLTLPPSAIYGAGTVSQGGISESGGLVTANLGNLPATGTATATVRITNTVPGTFSATATINSSNPDFDQSNNSVTVISHVAPPTSDLAAGIVGAPNPALVGGTLTYTVSVTNNGPSAATGVVSSNTLPPSVGILSVTPSQGTFNVLGNIVLCNFGSLSNQARATAAINVIPGAAGTLVASSVAIGSTSQIDPVAANNFATASIIVNPAADLTVDFLSAPAAVVVRSNFTYVIGATNRGPNDATGVVVNHTLPPNSILVSSNTTQGTFSFAGGVLACNVGPLAAGAGVGLTVVVAVTNAATVASTVTVSGSQTDPNTTNNVSTVSTIVSAPFVSIVPNGAALIAEYFTNGTPGLTNGSIDIGETVTLSFSLRNVGNVSTTNPVTATLQTNSGVLPSQPNTPQTYETLAPSAASKTNFTFKAAGTNGGTITAVLRLKDGANDLGTASFSFVLPSLSTFANTNRIDVPTTLQDQQDPGPGAPYPSTIFVSGATGLVGKVTVTLSNLNHTFPHDLNVLVVGPTGARSLLMSDAADGSSVSSANVTFDDSAAAPLPGFGQIFSGLFRPSGYDSAAQFSAPAPTGPFGSALAALSGTDPNGLWSLYVFDDSGGDFGNVANGWSLTLSTATPLFQPTDLRVTAVATPASVRVGNNVTNVFTVTNAGPSKSGGLWFTNIVPATAAIVSLNNSVQASFATNGSALSCYLGDSLDVGATATVTLVLSPVATNSPLTLSGTVVATNGAIDLNLANNSASANATVLLPFADLRVTQTLAPDPAVIGYSLTATVTVTNSGPGTAFNVWLTNTLPVGAGLLSYPANGIVAPNGKSVAIPLGNLTNNPVTAAITVTNTDMVPKTNIASVVTASLDTNAPNNSATNSVTVTNPTNQIAAGAAVLIYESGPKNGVIDLGETNTVQFYVQNLGNISVTNLSATLLASNGVLTSGPQLQAYGVIVPGTAVPRPFTFTTSPTNNGNVLATLRLDSVSATNLITFTLLVRTGFSNSTPIIIPDHGLAAPYPSTINVAGLTGVVSKARVALKGVSHTFPRDLNALLANPNEGNVVLMSHAGGAHALNNFTLTFDDSAATTLPVNDQIINNTTNQPGNYGSVTFPGPAPSSPYGSVLASAAGSDPNGNWSLYIYDDASGDAGTIANGWALDLTTTPVIAPPVLSAAISGGQLELTIAVQPGVYVILGSTDLNNWVPLSTNTAPASGTISFIDTQSSTLQNRYYRASRQLP